MKRTGSIGSLVGPEVTSTRLPASDPPLRMIASTAAAISSGSAMRPVPASPRSAISPAFGPMTRTPSALQLREVALRRLRRPHMRVHRRRQQDRLVGRQQHGGREIVGVATRHFRDQVGGRRRDHDHIGVARQADMADIKLALRIEQIGIGALAGQRAGRKRRDEMLRGGGENAAHAVRRDPASAESDRAICRPAMPPPMMSRTRRVFANARTALFGVAASRGRLEALQHLAAGFLGRLAQDDADLVFHRAAVPRGAQPQQPS